VRLYGWLGGRGGGAALCDRYIASIAKDLFLCPAIVPF
jgi:hypothetical protein